MSPWGETAPGDSPVGAAASPDLPVSSFTAAVHVVEPLADRRRRIAALRAKPPLRTFADADAFDRSVSATVAVAVFSLAVPADRIRPSIVRTLSASPHAHVVLLATEGDEWTDVALPRDRLVEPPLDGFPDLLTRMYLRAYYSAALERFYSLNLATIEGRRRRGADADEVAALEATTERVKAYLQRIRAHLRPEDLYELANREVAYRSLTDPPTGGSDPRLWGLPRSCPKCDLDWTAYHGPKLGTGYERIGAHTWRCARCSHVIVNPDPEHKRIL